MIGKTDLFIRSKPAAVELPDTIRRLARDVIDHGGFVLSSLRFAHPSSKARQIAIVGTFRRILITAEAIRVLISKGLEEPAVATMRTLLELEVNLRLILDDPTDLMARRLIFFYSVRGRRHFTKVACDTETREMFQEDGRYWTWAKSMGKFFKEQLAAGAFDDIQERCEKDQYWHGYRNQREAFAAADMMSDYNTLFDTASSFVHAGNVEHDFTGPGERIKSLVQRDPSENFARVAYVTANLVVIYQKLVEATEQSEYAELTVTITDEHGNTERMTALTALQMWVLSELKQAGTEGSPGSSGSHRSP